MSTTRNGTKPGTKRKARRSFGQVFRRPQGRGWLARFPDPDGGRTADGRRRVITRSVKTRAEGEALLKEVRQAVLRGAFAPKPEAPSCDLTVLEAVDGHLEAMEGQGKARSTMRLYEYSKKPLARQGLGHKRAADVTVADVERYLAWRRTNVWKTSCRPGEAPKAVKVKGGRASASTVARDRELLSVAFNRLVRLGLLAENVVAKVPKPKRARKKRVVLSKEEVARLIACCTEHLRPVVLTLAYTGARKGEVLGLRWRDVCLDSGTISVFRSKVGNADAIPLNPALAEELRRIKAARPKAAPSDPVFLSRLGKPYRDIKTGFASAVRRAGLEGRGVTPHALRHSFACHFLGGGAAITDLQGLLGHASLATTQIYARMVDRRTRASVEAMRF